MYEEEKEDWRRRGRKRIEGGGAGDRKKGWMDGGRLKD